MKIKTVCERTGLTDRTIRYYIEEGLISPAFSENYLGRKSFDFTEENISELTDIAVLRSFDFSIDEIKLILHEPSSSLAVIKAVKERVNGELNTSQKKMSVLSSLNDQTAYTVAELARELSKPHGVIPSEETINPRLGRRIEAIAKGVLFFLLVWFPPFFSVGVMSWSYVYYENPILSGVFLSVTLLTLIPSFVYVFSTRIKVLRKRFFRAGLFTLCLVCIPLCVLTASRTVSECEHSFRDLSVEVEASCVAEGRVIRRCDICRAVETVTLERSSHNVVVDSKTEPTCSAAGLTEGSHCSVCDAVLVRQESIPKIEHKYVDMIVEPTCRQDGHVLMVCYCGESYLEKTLFATEKHDFVKNGDMGFRCSLCKLEVCEYDYIDRNDAGIYDAVKYYITGTADERSEQERTLVIFGAGDMPTRQYGKNHPYRASLYVEEIKTVIICDGITSLAEGAFEAILDNDGFYGNPFDSVTSFIVKGDSLTLDAESKEMSGIECDITYQRSHE